MLSAEDHPFHGEEYCCVLLTTTGRSEAVRLADLDWVRGGPPRETHASPWVPMTLKATDVRDRQGRLAAPLVDRIASEVASYVTGGGRVAGRDRFDDAGERAPGSRAARRRVP